MGRFDRFKVIVSRAVAWAQRVYRKLMASSEHVLAIDRSIHWFIDQWDDLEPEVKEKIMDMEFHLEELKKIWDLE